MVAWRGSWGFIRKDLVVLLGYNTLVIDTGNYRDF